MVPRPLAAVDGLQGRQYGTYHDSSSLAWETYVQVPTLQLTQFVILNKTFPFTGPWSPHYMRPKNSSCFNDQLFFRGVSFSGVDVAYEAVSSLGEETVETMTRKLTILSHSRHCMSECINN
jgi:hypothetical protein